MPKFNMYQALHTTVIGPEGRPLEIQIRTGEMHETAEYGVAAHWSYKEGKRAKSGLEPTDTKLKWLKGLLDWQQDVDDPSEFTDSLRDELVEDEVFVFTPKGEVKSLAAGATPLDFAYEVHTDVGHRCVGAKVNGKIVPLHYELQSGDIVEVLTSKRERGPSRDWLAVVKTTRARNKIKRLVQGRVARGLRAHRPPAAPGAPQQGGAARAEADRLAAAGRRHPRDGLPQGRRLLHRPRRGQDLAQGRRQQGAAAPQAGRVRRSRSPRPPTTLLDQRRTAHAPPGVQLLDSTGSSVEGVDDVPLRLAKCCRPVSGDPILGYVSLGRGITIHRDDCPNVVALRKDPERFVPVEWDGENETSFKVELQVDALGSPPAARGPLAHVRGGRHQHRRGALHRLAPDGQEPLRRRGRRHAGAQGRDQPPALDRRGLRRLPRHADRRLARRGVPSAQRRAASTTIAGSACAAAGCA